MEVTNTFLKITDCFEGNIVVIVMFQRLLGGLLNLTSVYLLTQIKLSRLKKVKRSGRNGI